MAPSEAAIFSDLLRDHRRAAGLTQEELAERAGVSPRSISELERGGAHVPRRDTVALLVRALGLSGADREAFERLIDNRRRLRPGPTASQPRQTPTPQRPPMNNLPRSLTTFVGRDHELENLVPVLATAPLLTLVGAGGVGKTRLAQEIVRHNAPRYPDGAWIVELAGLTDPALVTDAVARVLGLRDIRGGDTTQRLTDYLRDKRLLLVLDNCEHLVAACAALSTHLLGECADLQILATSREPLAVAGEATWLVRPLEVPDIQAFVTADQIMEFPAARLFVERARAANNALVLTDENAAAIARICVNVDGIPLALELAAALSRLLTPQQLAERLEQEAGALSVSSLSRSGLPQHRTMRATIDWSHALLSECEQALLRRLSVFAGGWTLELAEDVCSGGCLERSNVLETLAQLVDKSVLQVDARESAARYRLLEPIRQYAAERLELSGESTVYRDRHAGVLLNLPEIGAPEPTGSAEMLMLERLQREHDNLRAALRWALDHADPAALRAAAGLRLLWERGGHFQEGSSWLEQALALRGVDHVPVMDRCRALNARSSLCWRGGQPERAGPFAEEALAIARAEGEAGETARALLNLGMSAFLLHEHSSAVAYLEDAAAAARQADEPPLLSQVLSYLGRALLWVTGPLDLHAAEVLHESIELAETVQSQYALGQALVTFGDFLWGQGDVAGAVP
ncbi:MAG: helix-turn-helix domain-containing protein, partial [Chloroflexi bacterium]|nr:helix-turn-helix domain-containing protein [Chloroflexota bacterium]